MDELNQDERAAYAAVDDALRTFPLEPTPVDFLPAVLARLEPRQLAARFRLSWLDYALSLFALGMAGLAWLLWPLLPLPIDWPARLQFRLLVWWQHLRYGGPLFDTTLLLGFGLLILVLLIVWLVASGPSGFWQNGLGSARRVE